MNKNIEEENQMLIAKLLSIADYVGI